MQQNKERIERTNQFAEFLVQLVSSALGGGKSGDSEEIGLDTGEGMDELSDEQIQMWKNILGPDDFAKQYPDYV